jgi:hypothetical protein
MINRCSSVSHSDTSPAIGDPVIRKNHIVSHYDILLSLGLKFEEQEGAGPPFKFLYKVGRDVKIRGEFSGSAKVSLSPWPEI